MWSEKCLISLKRELSNMGNGLYGYKEAAVGKERAKHSWPIRELLDAGALKAYTWGGLHTQKVVSRNSEQ